MELGFGLELFVTEEEADLAAIKIHGSKARLNFPILILTSKPMKK